MTESPFKLDTRAINWLAAIIIGLFVIFPDIVRFIDTDDDIVPPHQIEQFRPTPPDQQINPYSPNNHLPEKPPINPDFKPLKPDFDNGFPKIVFEFFYFFALSLILLFINNRITNPFTHLKKLTRYRLAISIISTLFICILAQYIYSLLKGFYSHGPNFGFFNGMVLFKCFFVSIITVLFSQLTLVLFKQQEIRFEMEQLRSENLQNRFDALTSQINPHFFFNSLNALSGLVRIKDNSNALKYINELSVIFRYVLKGKWQELVVLQDEMQFLEAYQYLLQIRYGERLSFNININSEDEQNYRLPYLSLQPLIENVIKHNIISTSYPMKINIFIQNKDTLIVSNLIQPKIEVEPSTGIGLNNLSNRYKLLVDKNIQSYIDKDLFIVELPLTSVDQNKNESTDY
nr:histidine kinase [uncultured Carboxylicivirga sp.]